MEPPLTPQSPRNRSDESNSSVITNASTSASNAAFAKLESINGLSIPPQDIQIVRKVGSGKFSDVYEAMVYGCRVAVKVPRPENPALKEAYFHLFHQEAHNLSKVIHHNVGRIYGFVFAQNPATPSSGEIWLVCEYLEGGTLQSLIDEGMINKKTGHPYSLYQRMRMARDIVKGMIFVHKHCLCHHDLKPDNIMLDAHGVIKVVDFGYAEKIKPGEVVQSQHLKGSPLWMAPEVMSLGQYNQQSDVYSWALICWQLLTKSSYPFPQDNVTWKQFREAVVQQGVRPEIPASCIPSLKVVLFHSWHPDPQRRPAFLDIDRGFDSILVDCAVQDEYARRFWMKEFGQPLRDRVHWDDFSTKFFAFLQLPLPEPTPPKRPAPTTIPQSPTAGSKRSLAGEVAALANAPLTEASSEEQLRSSPAKKLEAFAMTSPKAAAAVRKEMDRRETVMWARGLKELLVPKYLDGNSTYVYLERFGKITNHFGPILFNSISIFFNNIRILLQRAWYKGDLTREQSYRVLWNKPPGTFLVRMSAHPSHACVISVVLAGAGTTAPTSIGHYVIIQEPGRGFCLDLEHQQERHFFLTLPQLVDHYVRMGVLKEVCNFDWRELSVQFDEQNELDEDFLLGGGGGDAYMKSFLKQFAGMELDLPARQYLASTHQTDADALKWSAFAMSMVHVPKPQPATDLNLAEHLQRLMQRLELYRLTLRREIPNDGNCLFAAVADQIYGNTSKALEIRATVAQWLRQNPMLQLANGMRLHEYVRNATWEEYCNYISLPLSWGDHICLIAIAELCNVNISVISSIPGSHFIINITPQRGPAPTAPLLLSHWAELHYGSLTRIPDAEAPQAKKTRP